MYLKMVFLSLLYSVIHLHSNVKMAKLGFRVRWITWKMWAHFPAFLDIEIPVAVPLNMESDNESEDENIEIIDNGPNPMWGPIEIDSDNDNDELGDVESESENDDLDEAPNWAAIDVDGNDDAPNWAAILEDSESDDDDDGFEDVNVKAFVRCSIRNGIKHNSEDEQSVGSFLEQRISEALQDYDNATNGLLMKKVHTMGRKGDDLMQSIRRKANWFSIRQTAWPYWELWDGIVSLHDRSVYRICVDLESFGCFSIEVETKVFNIGNHGSLTHGLCCLISTRLAKEYLHSSHCSYPEEFCSRWCDAVNQSNWAEAAEWKTRKLQLPETLRKQLVSTMQWQFWAEILNDC